MKQLHFIVGNHVEVLNFLKSRFPLYHGSNVFFRDIQYGVMSMLEGRGIGVSYPEAERFARALIEKLEKEKILARLDHQTWVLRYPDFRTPRVAAKTAAPAGAKPTGSAASAAVPPSAAAAASAASAVSGSGQGGQSVASA
jgi:hypothetical protein